MRKKLQIGYFFALFFNSINASIKEYLADIFSVNNSNYQDFSWYMQDEQTIKDSLCTMGWGLFKSIHINDRFENKYDLYQLSQNLKKIDESIKYEQNPALDSKDFLYKKSTRKFKQLATQNPFDKENQHKIINIRKFLHLFCTIDPFLSSEKIVEKLHLNNYWILHDHYINYALKIDLLSKIIDPELHHIIDKSYLNLIDPLFKIKISETDKNTNCIYDWRKSNDVEWYEKITTKSLNLFLTQMSPETDNSDILNIAFNNIDTCSIANLIRKEINSFIQSRLECIIKIQALIRKYNEGYLISKKETSCKLIQSYIRSFNQCIGKKLSQENIFKSNPYNNNVPNEIWNKIIFSCTPESLTDLMCVNKRLYNLITQNSDLIINTAQKLDDSIEFDLTQFNNENWTSWMNFPNKNKGKQDIIFQQIIDPFNKKNQNKIKSIRMLISTINDSSKNSDEIALKLQLYNYCFFYNQYFTYALKALAYINSFSSDHLKEYLILWDKNFYPIISNDFIIEEQYENYNFFHMNIWGSCFNANAITIPILQNISDLQNINMIRIKPSDFLRYLKKERKCFISDRFIQYFDNPTRETKNNLLEYEKKYQNALIKLQSYIRKYNAESFLLNYPHSIVTIQSYIRRKLCYKTLIELIRAKVIQKKDAAQIIQNHIRRVREENKLEYEKQYQNTVITIQKHCRKIAAEQLKIDLRKKALHKSTLRNQFLNNLDSLSEEISRKRVLLKIMISTASVIVLFMLYKAICYYKKPC